MQSSILAWKVPWTEEPGGPQCMELQKVGYNLAHMHSDHHSQAYSVISPEILICRIKTPQSDCTLPY